jgi:hypothetical protein
MGVQDDAVYEELRRQLDKMPVGMPKTAAGEKIRILKHLFTKKQAHVALFLNMVFKPAEKIYRSCGQFPDPHGGMLLLGKKV